MRGTVLNIAENFQAEYYDIISTKMVNGVKKYEYDKMPQTFMFAESSISGATVFQSTKGFEQKATDFGGVYQLNTYKYKIQTSNSIIDFKINGKIKIFLDGEFKTFNIVKITYLTGYNKGLQGKRPFIKENSIKCMPKILELN